jgi:hypothetical protein
MLLLTKAAALVRAADALGPAQQARLWQLMAVKLAQEEEGSSGWGRIFISGIVANW